MSLLVLLLYILLMKSMLLQLQMIIERLFMGGNVEQSVEELSGDQWEFSVIEENAIYHAAGYVIRKLIKKFRRNGGENAYMDTAILLHMIGEGTVGDVPDSTDSFLDYVKVWTNNIDRGGLSHASNDAYRFFVALETAFYHLLKSGEPKDKIISGIMTNANVLFLWEIATDLPEDKSRQSLLLLQEVVQLWYSMRGFSIANNLLEQYKKAMKTTTKGRKGIRKELH